MKQIIPLIVVLLSCFWAQANEDDKKLQALIEISESGSYAVSFNKDDLFCAKANKYTDAKKNVNKDAKLSALEKAKHCGLTEAEYNAIYDYTVEGNFAINAVLRKQKSATAEDTQKIKLIQSGLNKIAPVEGMTVRQTDLPAEEFKKHIPGKIVNYPAFTSTSINLTYDRDQEFTFFILVKNCKYISALSNITTEQEVLCAPGANFKIKAYAKREVAIDSSDPLRKTLHHYYLMEQVN